MNAGRNGKRHSCKYCASTRRPRKVDEARGNRIFRIAFCPVCYTVTAAWEREGRCMSPIDVEKLYGEQFTMLDLGEVIQPGRRGSDPLNLAEYREDAGERPEGVPVTTPFQL